MTSGRTGRLYLAFIVLTILSCLGLDYLGWKKGESSLFFSWISPKEEEAEPQPPLAEVVLNSLEKHGLPRAVVHRSKDRFGADEFRVILPLDSYASLAADLENRLLKHDAAVHKEEKEEREEVTFTWIIMGKKEEKLSLLFSCQRPVTEEVAGPPPLARNRAAIVIDDMGFSLEALQEICDLNIPITISILPLSPLARETAETANERGLEVMLHLPCESINHQEGDDGTFGIIHSSMSNEDVRILTEDFLGRVPFIKGVNNHMGSKITRNEPIMRTILGLLAERNLFFLDSRTTANSIAYELARQMGLRSAYRNVFLDSPVGVNFSAQKLVELLKLSQETGQGVGIGHPFPETLRALRENIHLFKTYDVEPVFASRIVW
ncbi:MAG: divergent polysaccharide deacetylase family protein [Clostridiales bacterium]|nr:divergent polysaccharide deacetylase family protein [Clostridiales bacterium]